MKFNEPCSRRHMMKAAGMGIAGTSAIPLIGTNAFALNHEAALPYRSRGGRSLYQLPEERSTAALIKGNDRADNIYKALKLIEDQVLSGIKGKQILIKPNFVQTNKQLAATHVDAIKGILEFLRPHYKKEILIGEAAASKEGTIVGYKNYGYYDLVNKYKVKLVDLNLGGYEYRYTLGEGNKPIPIRICSPFLDPNVYIISTAIMKTHGYASVTLSLKNVLLGAPVNDYKVSDKFHMHMGPHGEPDDIIHFNMFHMAQHVFPDLAVIDGFTGMEGDGPSRGTPIDSHIAVASVDPLAADVLSARLMGFDSKKILYLSSMTEAGMGQGNLDKITVLGNKIEECSYHFKISPILHFSAALDS
jgi:uncharacterized protein (DUF362 family)